MIKSSYVYLLLALIIISVFVSLTVTQKDKSISGPVKITTPQTNQEVSPTDTETAYIDFTDSDFENNKSKRRVLFFYANWCTTCRPVNAEFLKNPNQLPDDVIVYRVNYRDSDTDEAEKELAEKYKITYQHTFVQVNQQGNVIKKWNGGNLADLVKNVN